MAAGDIKSRLDQALRELSLLASRDIDPWTGRVFTHVYDPGMDEVRETASKALELYRDKTMLDFTVYPSIIELEKQLLGFAGHLFHAPEGYAGTFTYGGTESIILAVLAARERWRRAGGSGAGRIVMPITAHPAFAKAAYLLGLKVERVPVDGATMQADPAIIEEKIDRDTVMIIASAVDYPYGSLDPVEDLGSIAVSRDVWLHVDACIGGMVLAFASDAGEGVEKFDFRVEGVRSFSVDMHKYGYAPKGSSILLFRRARDKKPTIFVDSSWPGYPLVNQAILSTRSAGTLAAAWAVARTLGVEGYRELARMVLEARRRIQKGLESLGLEVLGRPKAGILSFTHSDIDVVELATRLDRAGWVVQLQPGNKHLGFPTSIHLTISPIHARVVDSFLAAVEESIRGAPKPESKFEPYLAEEGFKAVEDLLRRIENAGFDDKVVRAVNEMIYLLEPDVVAELIKEAMLEIFKPSWPGW
ncbi:putative pyridoxal-dependent decarboxylase [Aeropyrum pernix]|uniref:Putative pyridoxal-dependent decarboxylase n=1 Tax=Aeropyrum pernix TaxID=56636 RepID=A0A401HBU1_AERPX|nr:aspartate aminotransferase family protein [Aeropyrum pernix]GBF09916.1 putative pyridoxal-dependent decarboxylase [Aeropyrum pernix]